MVLVENLRSFFVFVLTEEIAIRFFLQITVLEAKSGQCRFMKLRIIHRCGVICYCLFVKNSVCHRSFTLNTNDFHYIEIYYGSAMNACDSDTSTVYRALSEYARIIAVITEVKYTEIYLQFALRFCVAYSQNTLTRLGFIRILLPYCSEQSPSYTYPRSL